MEFKCGPEFLWSPSYKSGGSVAVDQVLGGVVSVGDKILEPANEPRVYYTLTMGMVLYSMSMVLYTMGMVLYSMGMVP